MQTLTLPLVSDLARPTDEASSSVRKVQQQMADQLLSSEVSPHNISNFELVDRCLSEIAIFQHRKPFNEQNRIKMFIHALKRLDPFV